MYRSIYIYIYTCAYTHTCTYIYIFTCMWAFPKIGGTPHGWFTTENPIDII